jgi:hypothetical protein
MTTEPTTPTPEPAKAAPAKAAAPAATKDAKSDPVDESKYEIDEELGSVATVPGSLGEVDTSDTDDESRSVATEVGSLGWPEGAENEPNLGPDGKAVDDESEPSWTVERRDREERKD